MTILQCIPSPIYDLEHATESWLGGLRDESGYLPLRSVDIRSEVSGVMVRSTLTQRFSNPRTEAVEVTYVFPLPDHAAVDSFVAVLGGREVRGILKERGAARAEYDAAIAAGKRAAIAEEERSGVFTLRVGNLLPGEDAEVRLTLAGRVELDLGEATYRFPLVVAPRYVPGSVLEGEQSGQGVVVDTDTTPDASRISPPVLLPGMESPVALSLECRFEGSVEVSSSLHAVQEEDGVVRILPGERLDRDVILRWRMAEEKESASGIVSSDAPGEGTWSVTLWPGTDTDPAPRHVAILLDRSGSMSGWKMVAARRAAARIVDSLNAKDHFTILAFDTVVEEPKSLTGLIPATDRNRFAAVEWLSGLEARGGTEMREALTRGMGALAGKEGASLVLVTDGQVGNEDHLLGEMAPRVGATRVYALGIDRAVNAGFLRRLAALGAGRCELVESEDRLDDVLASIHRRISPPLITGVRVEGEGVLSELTTGGEDCFPGSPLVLSGRWRGARPSVLTLRGTSGGSEVSYEVVSGVSENPAWRLTWARERVRSLEDRYVVSRSEEVEREIVSTSLTHGVLSRFTAYVAVDEESTSSTSPVSVIQPVETPSGWGAPLRGAVGGVAQAAYSTNSMAAGGLYAAAPAGPSLRSRAKMGGMVISSTSSWTETFSQPVLPASFIARIRTLLSGISTALSWTQVEEIRLLVEDLESVGADVELVSSLKQVLQEGGSPSSVQRVEVVLSRLSSPGGAPGVQRAPFWKA